MKFNSPENALRWAYEVSNKPITGPSSSDVHAQAALVIGLCERVLPSLHMAYVRVQFGRESGGFELLTRHLATNFGTGLHARRSIEKIIRAYCGEKIGLREIRKAMGCAACSKRCLIATRLMTRSIPSTRRRWTGCAKKWRGEGCCATWRQGPDHE